MTESWLNLSTVDSSDYFQIPGYVRINKDRVDRAGGGVLIYLKFGINFAVCNNEHKESIWLKITSRDVAITFALVYRPDDRTDREIASDINCYANHSRVCIVGDFNLPTLDCIEMSSNSTNLVYNAFINNFLTQKVTEATRENNILDLVLSSSFNLVENLEVIDPLANSDHNSIKFNLQFLKPEVHNFVKKPNFRKANFEKMRSDILNLNNHNFLSTVGPIAPFEALMTKLADSQNTCIPFSRAGKQKNKAWITESLKTKIGVKRSLYKRAKVNPSFLQQYKTAERELKIEIFKAKSNYEDRLAVICQNNPSVFFKYHRSSNKECIVALQEGSRRISDSLAMGNVLNKYFASVFNDKLVNRDINFELNPSLPLMPRCTFTNLDVIAAINNLSAYKSVGPDLVYARTLKETKMEIAPLLCHIFNAFLEYSYVPDDWKLANVVPIFKKGGKEFKENYRPISLTSIVCKLMESIIVNKLTSFLESNNLLNPRQHGFRRGKSCVSNLISFYNNVAKCVDKGGCYDVIFLDFSKAFDKIPHCKLLDKLCKLNVDRKLIEWISEWLTDRKQRVQINGECTGWLPVTSGVPQGSCLGPLLFIIFINDFNFGMNCDVGLFADDAKLGREIRSIDDITSLQVDLDLAFNWCNNECMTLNADKCVIMHFGKKNPHIQYSMNGEILNAVQEQRDLGVLVNESFSFSDHCSKVRNKAAKVVSFIRQSVSTRNPVTMVKLFSALVRPILEYGAQFWSPHLMKDIDLLESVQRNFTKMIDNFHFLSYDERLRTLDLFSLQYRRDRGQIIETFKYFINSPDTAQNLFSFPESSRTRGHKFKLERWPFRTEIGRSYITNKVVPIWNSLSEVAIDSPSIDAFKKILDDELSTYRRSLRY